MNIIEKFQSDSLTRLNKKSQIQSPIKTSSQILIEQADKEEDTPS